MLSRLHDAITILGTVAMLMPLSVVSQKTASFAIRTHILESAERNLPTSSKGYGQPFRIFLSNCSTKVRLSLVWSLITGWYVALTRLEQMEVNRRAALSQFRELPLLIKVEGDKIRSDQAYFDRKA